MKYLTLITLAVFSIGCILLFAVNDMAYASTYSYTTDNDEDPEGHCEVIDYQGGKIVETRYYDKNGRHYKTKHSGWPGLVKPRIEYLDKDGNVERTEYLKAEDTFMGSYKDESGNIKWRKTGYIKHFPDGSTEHGSYKYDDSGKLVGTTVTKTSADGKTQVVQEFDANGNLIRRTIYERDLKGRYVAVSISEPEQTFVSRLKSDLSKKGIDMVDLRWAIEWITPYIQFDKIKTDDDVRPELYGAMSDMLLDEGPAGVDLYERSQIIIDAIDTLTAEGAVSAREALDSLPQLTGADIEHPVKTMPIEEPIPMPQHQMKFDILD